MMRNAKPTRRAVFLDRDGTINQAVLCGGRPFPPANVEEFLFVPDAVTATWKLKTAGFLLIVVTNQPDVARGTQTIANVEAIHSHLRTLLPLDDIIVSYEDGENPRRKPAPGMLLEAAEHYDIDLGASFMVGDRWRDVEAGRRAGCRTVFLDSDYAEKKPDPPADHTVRTLMEAVDWIIEQKGIHRSESP